MARSRILLLSSFTVVGVGAALAASLFVLGPARAAVGPLPAEGLAFPAGTRLLLGVEVARLVESPLYERIQRYAGADPFKELRDKAGIDPARDVERIVVAVSVREGQDAAVVMGFGRFDGYTLGRAVEKREGVTWKEHAGKTLYLFGETSRTPGALAFLDGDVVVVGAQGAVEETLTNRRQGISLRTNGELMALLGQVKPGSAFWLVGDRTLLERLPSSVPGPGTAPQNGLRIGLPALKSLVATGELAPELMLDVIAEAADEPAARNLADLVRGGWALLSLQAAQRPELEGVDLSTAVAVSTDAQRVKLALRLPYTLLDALGPKPRATSKPEASSGPPSVP